MHTETELELQERIRVLEETVARLQLPEAPAQHIEAPYIGRPRDGEITRSTRTTSLELINV